jgi:hypothetical protein
VFEDSAAPASRIASPPRARRAAATARTWSVGWWQSAASGGGTRSAEEERRRVLQRIRIALTAPPGARLAAGAEDAAVPETLTELGEAGMLGLVRAGQGLAAWGEYLRLTGIEALYQSRRQLGSRDNDALADLTDEQVAAGAGLQQVVDDLAGRSVAAEVAATCGISEYAVGRRLDCALELNRLPDTWAALRRGEIDWPKAASITDAARPLDETAAAAVEAMCLPAAGRQSTRALQAALARAVIVVDPGGARRREELAQQSRGVSFRMGQDVTPDGMGEMTCRLSAPDLLGLRSDLDVLADAAKGTGGPGDRRTLNQRRADVLVDLFANAVTHQSTPTTDATAAADSPEAPPTAASTNVPTDPATAAPATRAAPASAASAASADTVRAPATEDTPAAADRVVGPASASAPAGSGSVTTARASRAKPHIVVTVGLETLLGHNDAPADLAGYGPITAGMARDLATRGTWRCAVVDGDHGTILGVGRSTFSARYQPPEATARLVRMRDQTCTFPGCRRQAGRCDLDHRIPYSRGGPTCECNLQTLCGNHHRLKHEAGFRVRVSEDPDDPPGTVVWTTPTGAEVHRCPPSTAGHLAETLGRSRLPDEPPF